LLVQLIGLTGAVEITLPVAIVAAAYIIGQAMVDASGDWGAAEGKEKRGGSEGRPACGLCRGAGGGGYMGHL